MKNTSNLLPVLYNHFYMIPRFIKKNLLIILLLLGIGIRISLMFTTYNYDVYSFVSWGKDSANGGFSGFYERFSIQEGSYPAYPPLSIYFFNGIYQLRNILFNFFWNLNIQIPSFPSGIIPFLESPNFLGGLIKLPPIIADIGLAYLAFLYTKNIWAVVLILLNPAFFYTSAVWGQYDSVALFFTALSLYISLYRKKNYILSFFFFALALLAKQSMIIFIPVFFVVLFIKGINNETMKQWNNLFLYIAFFFLIPAIVFFLFFLPFYHGGNTFLFPFKTYFEKNIAASGLPFISNHSFNFWALVSQWKNIPDSSLLWGIAPYRLTGYIIAFGLFFISAVVFAKRKLNNQSTIYFFFISSFIFFLFLTRIHERHFQPALFFLLLLAFRARGFMGFFLALSLFHFANLYHNMLYPYSRFFDNVVHSKITENGFILLGLVIFILCYRRFLKEK